MWIVRLALRRTYTFVVVALLIFILGSLAILRMPTDIFPEINIPVVSVIWSYSGISPDEMAARITTVSERAFTTTVNDIEHMESQSMQGVAVIKIFFHPSARIEEAVSEISATSETILRVFPAGTFAPSIVRYNASSVPILQMAVGGKGLSEQQLYDYSLNFIRNQLAAVQGATVLAPSGGKPRQIMVDLDPQALYGKGLSPNDVVTAVNAQSLILPAGTAKMGDREYNVRLNSSPLDVEALNDLPIRQVNGATVYVRDVAHVRDGTAVQQNIVRLNGQRSALLSVLKNGGASTLQIISHLKGILPRVMRTLPSNLEIKQLFDQSLFVRASINGVVREATIAAVLTGLMILLFLGSWRSTLIVCISIPLSILTSLIVLYLLNETINVMTLGGLALAVGILVDDATVEIENIHRNLAQKKSLIRAILDGASQIAVPAFVSTLAICIVFVPVIFLSGAARYLFTPLAMAVVFAMLSSYLLSRTLVPTMVQYLLESELDVYRHSEGEHAIGHGIVWRIHHGFNRQFERFRNGYGNALRWTLNSRKLVVIVFSIFVGLSGLLATQLGEDFFPQVDAGAFRLHVRTPPGTRIETTEQIFSSVESDIRQIIPQDQIDAILDNIGLPPLSYTLAYTDSATLGASDGEILVSLKEGHDKPTSYYKRLLRERLPKEFAGCVFFFQSADIVNQILNFGLAAPVDVQVVGRNPVENYKIALDLERQISEVEGTADVHLHQVVNVPELRLNVDRTKAGQFGLTQRDVANSLLISLSSSTQVAPNYWLNPANGVNYPLIIQTPQQRINSIETLQRTPIAAPDSSTGSNAQLLSNLASVGRGNTLQNVNHYNVQPVFDIEANVQDRDLGGVAKDIRKIISTVKLPRGSFIDVRGQVETMRSSFIGLAAGMIMAVLLVYFLMVVNFQGWLDPFIILMALPGCFAGIVWMLFVTQTTLSVPSLMGAIMSVGVATANSILLVTFANEQREEGKNAMDAAYSAGLTRLRPVIMTALAMIIGMLPMSLGLGEGGEQNAPLGRAVIGGLALATFATLFFVPVMYSYLRSHTHEPNRREDWELLDEK